MIAKAADAIRVVSLNLNGLRSAASKGVLDWIEQSGADIVCLQETRLTHSQWGDSFKLPLWHHHLFAAEKAGYAGTAIYSRLPFVSVRDGLGFEICDTQGRFTAAEFQRPDGSLFTVASAYFPSGSSGDEAQARKDEFLRQILPTLSAWQQQGKSLILCGDVNIVHKAIDIKNWNSNQKNSGCLPHERAWLDTLFDHVGYVDAFRVKNQQAHEYSWWSNRGQAYANNVGWRIDYQIASTEWHDKIQQVAIFREVKFSDHAPVIVDYCLQG